MQLSLVVNKNHERRSNRRLDNQDRLQAELNANGYAFFRAAEIGLPYRLTPAQSEFVKLVQQLPTDRYSKDGNRSRCLHYGVYTPSDKRISFGPTEIDPETGEEYVGYDQGGANPEHRDVVRRFAPMPPVMQKNAALQQIVRRDFEVAPFSDAEKKNRFGFGLTLHVIRHTVRWGEKVPSSPDLIHRDNVLLSFVHVIERRSVRGGVNCIVKPEHIGKRWTEVPVPDVLAQVIVSGDFADGYAFRDDVVGHYVSSIEAASVHEVGARTILIVDFAKLREDLPV